MENKYCVKCGNKLKKDELFCTKCGNKVETTAEEKKVKKKNTNEKKIVSEKKKTSEIVSKTELEKEIQAPTVKPKSKKKIVIILSILLVLIGVGVGLLIFFLTRPKLEFITLSADNNVSVGKEIVIKVDFYPSEAKEDVKWKSSDEKIATVKDGRVKGISSGKAVITATTTSGITKGKEINVLVPATDLTISESGVEMFAGDTKQLTATIKPDNATNKEVKWESSNSSVATVSSDGLITAKDAGETKIKASTSEGLEKECTVVVKNKPIEFSGSGDTIISNINVPKGLYKAVLSNEGAHNFIVHLYDQYDDKDYLANEMGSYNGSVVLKDGKTNQITDGMLEVKSSGNWNIKFEPIGGTIEGKTISGSGDTVTGMFKGEGKRHVVTFHNDGAHNFIVHLYDQNGKREHLVNEIGAYDGQTTFTTKSSSNYFFSVTSSGSWTISWE